MPISSRRVKALSADLRRLIDGQSIDIRDNREGALSRLKNDIQQLVTRRDEETAALRRERDMLKDTLADISHQIKTPLTSIGIMADLLEDAPTDKTPEFAANIRKSLDRVEWLVSALLKMAKLDAGAVELRREEAASDEIIDLALEPARILLEVRNQRVKIGADRAFIACDKRWTAEALTNIIKNASEHSPEGGEIVIRSGSNPISAWISVTDCGGGITRAEIPALFKRFQGSRSETGYGIGLPLAMSIMNGQGGDIEVTGGEGQGATFALKFYRRNFSGSVNSR